MNHLQRLFGIFIALGMLVISGNSLHADAEAEVIVEPPTILFGKIYNRAANSEVLNQGELTAQIQIEGGTSVSMATDLSDYSNGEYSYVLEIPHQALSLGLADNAQYLSLHASSSTLTLQALAVDGYTASVVTPARSTIELSQEDRGRVLRLDLEVSLPEQDFDDDGIPDWWEDVHGLDKQFAGDATGDGDDDGLNNLAEYLRGTDPNRSDLKPSILTSELVAYASGTSIMLLQSADVDTEPENLTYQFTSMPASGILARWDPTSRILTALEAGAQMTQAQISQGQLRFKLEDAAENPVERFSIALSDGSAAYAATTAEIAIYITEPVDPEASLKPLESIRADLSADVAAGVMALDLGRSTTASSLDLSAETDSIVPEGEVIGAPFAFVLISGSPAADLTGSPLSDFIVASQSASGSYSGGAGSDTFYFLAAKEQQTVEDFSIAEGDVLDFSGLLVEPSSQLFDYLTVTLVGDDTQLNVYAGGTQAGLPDLTINLPNQHLAQSDLVELYYNGQLASGDVALDPRISIAAVKNAEEKNESSGSFVLTREGDLSSELTTNITLSGTASNGSDFRTILPTVIFGANESEATLSVSPFADGITEPTEKLIVTLTPNAGYTLGEASSAEIEIRDQLPELYFEVLASKAVADPIQPGLLLLHRTSSLGASLFVPLEITGSASNGVDYTYVSPFIEFSPGVSVKPIQFIPSAHLAALPDSFVKTIRVAVKEGATYDVVGDSEKLYLIKEQMTFAEWTISRQSGEAVAAAFVASPSAPTDGDATLLHYALAGDMNTEPKSEDLAANLTLLGDYVEISYRRNLLASDVVATVEYMLPGGDWVDAGSKFVLSDEDGSDPSVMVYRSSMKYTEQDVMLVRIRVDINE
ncbi:MULTISPECIES: Calx-beta domain-containing protein [unclassified Lentimonas]|nr:MULTISPECIES: Calx-beta domain-containing protein [unclassified Lentimonas]